jgi:ferredoxin-NADP reductase
MTDLNGAVGADTACEDGYRPAGHPSALDVWGRTGDTTLVCRQVHRITDDVRTFLFEPAATALFQHEPGQFVTLQLQIDGSPVSRCYTISSPPTRPHLLGITVKRQPGGLVSNWLHDSMVPGRRVSATGPFGIFTIARRPSPKYLFLSGGSGITPVMSMTRTLHDLGSDADVLFVHSARTPADIIFRRELETIASTVPTVRVVHVCEHDAPQEPWGGLRGRVGTDMLRLLVPDLTERVVFCCGPAPYMAAVRRALRDIGLDMQRYHEESFSFADLAEQRRTIQDTARPEQPGASARTFTVEFARSGRSFTCRPDEYVLDAAFAAGLNPASSCGQGMCGTCTSTLLSGSVDMHHNGGIRPREIAQNKVLICCSKPLSDLTIDA